MPPNSSNNSYLDIRVGPEKWPSYFVTLNVLKNVRIINQCYIGDLQWYATHRFIATDLDVLH